MEKVVKLKPVIKTQIWGGNFFVSFKNLKTDIASELWELSTRDSDSCLIDSGKDKGNKLVDIITKEDIGPISNRMPYFPLLIKLIDAKENLSVQVHPSDEYALKQLNTYGKTEMWHIISADKNSGLYVGFNKDYTKKEIEEKLNNNSILDALNFFKVKAGDTFLINAGTVHAIGKGVRLLEIQQNSDLTYRLYDYLRKDKDGNYRQLHIDEAMKVINFKKYQKQQNTGDLLAKTSYFTVKKITFDGEIKLTANHNSFISFTFLDGEGKVDDIDYHIFDTFFLPFSNECTISGKGTIVISEVQ